jgi:hypothetical protein
LIALWVGVAAAQSEALYGACDIFQPVAGTAGFANAIDAIRINATTYSAGEFARRRLRGRNYFAWDMHLVAGAARVPTLCTGQGRYAGEMYEQPLDLGATNLGLDAPLLHDGPLNSSLEVFYAASVTQSAMGSRALSWSLPLLNLYPAVAAPAIGTYNDGRGLFTYAVDWIGGAYLKSDVVSVQAGYTGSRGLYLDITQDKAALFVNGILADGLQWSDASYLMLGVLQFDPLKVGLDQDKVGMSSLFYRDLPSGGSAVAPEPRAGIVERTSERLRTGHVRQEDIARLLDVRAAWEFSERFRVRELAVGLHTQDWHRREKSRSYQDEAGSVRVGFVNLPDQPLLGLKGGVRPTIRADYLQQVGSEDTFGLRLSARMNDPDLLDLYPFAYNALGVNLELTYIGSEF